jgi:hypothetical protein
MLSNKEFAGKIKTVTTNAANVRATVQELLVTAAFYAYKDKNYTPFAQILSAVGDGSRKAGIYAWAETFAPMRVVKGELVGCKVAHGKVSVTTEAEYLELIAETGAAETMWYETVEKEKAVSVFDPTGYLAQVLKKLNKEGMPDLADHIRRGAEAYALEVAMAELAEGK